MASDPEDIAERLSSIAEELADVAIDRLRQASESVRSGEDPDPQLMTAEKRITRARRSVERAVALLAGPTSPASVADEGP
ncbi:MAG: hypothetical protein ACRDYE_09745 [Acidimicrobiales bacterium]